MNTIKSSDIFSLVDKLNDQESGYLREKMHSKYLGSSGDYKETFMIVPIEFKGVYPEYKKYKWIIFTEFTDKIYIVNTNTIKEYNEFQRPNSGK